jgi:LysR family glycine cleavage system transcriptional activator
MRFTPVANSLDLSAQLTYDAAVTDWRDIPSLSSLRAFEAAARLGSLSGAARELNVTHAAIAAHVRTLEGAFGTVLLTREGRGMAPTDDGARLARGLTEGFGTIVDACRDLAARGLARPVSVTTTPTFAENWLMPRLPEFWTHHPDISVTITPSPDVTDLRRDGHDIAIRYGEGGWPGFDSEPLLTDDFVVLASPGLARRIGEPTPAALLDQYWIMSTNRAEEPYVLRALGAEDGALKLRTMATNGMVVSAIRAGMGVGLQSRTLIQAELEVGRMVEIAALRMEGVGYHVVTRPGVTSEPLERFRRWLRRATA